MKLTVDTIAQSLLEYYQTQNCGGEDRVFLLTTTGSYIGLFGQSNLEEVATIAKQVWRESAKNYMPNGSHPSGYEALIIASYQCLLAFQESSADDTELSEDSLGVFIAAELGEKGYDHGLQKKYFNPTDETVESQQSFQYVIWRTVQQLFKRETPSLRLNIPEPTKYKGRWLQYPKEQVFINHADIYKLGRFLLIDYRFLEDPSGETVRKILFEKWKTSKSYFNKTFRKWVEQQSRSGKIERLYCSLIAKYIREKSFNVVDERVDVQPHGRSDRRNYHRVCVEIVAGNITFYEYDGINDQFYKISRKASDNLKSEDYLFFARPKGAKYNMYRQIQKVGPLEGSYFVMVKKHQVSPPLLEKVIPLDPDYKNYIGLLFDNLFSLLREFPAVKKICESEHTYLTAEGGLKRFGQNYEYYEEAGPHLPAHELPVRKIGYGIVDNYSPDTVTSGSYRATNGSFTVVPFIQATADHYNKGFSLSTWSYVEDEIANIVGFTVQNPVPELITRKWIEEVLKADTGVRKIEAE